MDKLEWAIIIIFIASIIVVLVPTILYPDQMRHLLFGPAMCDVTVTNGNVSITKTVPCKGFTISVPIK